MESFRNLKVMICFQMKSVALSFVVEHFMGPRPLVRWLAFVQCLLCGEYYYISHS